MDKQEKIVCAAVKVTYSIGDDIFQSILKGPTHKGIYWTAEWARLNSDFSVHAEEGFVTNQVDISARDYRFVDPIEAQQITIACGQYRDPHIRIKSLEKSIEVGWDSVKYAKTSVMITSLKKQIAEDQAALDALKTGYLGNALRVEDLHYV